MKDLEPIADFVKDFMDEQAELHKGGNWAFWSGYPAMDVANANASMTLEKSALGAIFDGSKFDGAGRVELWATLSKAYATYAAKDFDKKKFMGFKAETTGLTKTTSLLPSINSVRFLMRLRIPSRCHHTLIISFLEG